MYNLKLDLATGSLSFMIFLFTYLLLQPARSYSQLVEDSFTSTAMAQNLTGESAQRELLVYLPPGYETDHDKRYPVIYLLHSYGSGPSSWLGEKGYEGLNVVVVLDSLINNQVIEPVIVVMPDLHNRFGGTWYTNSEVAGNWIDFLAEDLIGHVDSSYRTIPDRKSRGIAGQSSGGYGALVMGMKRPEVFGAVLSMSPPNIYNPNPFGEAGWSRAMAVKPDSVESAHIIGKLLWAKAVAFSPNPDKPPFYAELPFQKEGNGFKLNEKIWEKWKRHTLDRLVSMHQNELRGTEREMLLRIEVGDEDPLVGEVRRLGEKLRSLGIEHHLEIFEGDHIRGVRKQFEESVFQFFDNDAHF